MMQNIPELSQLRAVLFDLDGTLVDSAPDIADACNELLKRHGLAALSLEQVRSMIGNGIQKLVERAFYAQKISLTQQALAERSAEMMSIYSNNLTNKTCPMPGAEALIAHLHGRGVRIAIVTNKPAQLSQKIVDHFCWQDYVSAVVGGDTLPNKKPAPDMLIYACEQMSVNVSRSIMVGDSPADIDAAIAASMVSVAICGGYTNIPTEQLGADATLESLDALHSVWSG